MLAPVALYPDPLLAQIFMASTYPLEVVEAARWVKQNPNPQGGASVAEFIIGKHRNGPRDTVKVAWLGQYTSFENLASTPTIQSPDATASL